MMINKEKNKIVFSLLTLSIIMLFIAPIIGVGLFFNSSNLNSGNSANITNEPVCYNQNGTTTTYYTSIEKALEIAGQNNTSDTIYVIPDNVENNVRINRNCTIASQDTLILPYEGTTWDFREGSTTASNKFADASEEDVIKNRKTLVTISSGVTLTIEGTLNIGGVLGNAAPNNQGLQGQTSGYYSEILLEAGENDRQDGASIDVKNNGKIDCRGYIKETQQFDSQSRRSPKLYINNGSTLNIPFVIYDYQGANATGAIYCGNGYTLGIGDIIGGIGGKEISPNGYICPFRLYDMPNIQVLTYIYSGSVVNGYVSLHTNKTQVIITFEESWNLEQFTLVGTSNSLLQIQSGYITVRYKPKNLKYTTVDSDSAKTFINIYGKCNFGSMQMKLNAQIVTVNVNTANVYFPISYRYDIGIESGGEFNLLNPIKFMNGSSLTINKGAILNASSNLLFYNNSWKDYKTTTCYYPVYSTLGDGFRATTSCEVSGTANFINNGSIRIDDNVSIGGLLETNSINSVLNVGKMVNFSCTDNEANGTGSIDGVEYIFTTNNETSINENFKAKIFDEYSVITSNKLDNATWISEKNGDEYAYYRNDYKLELVGPDQLTINNTGDYNLSGEGFLNGPFDSYSWSVNDNTLATIDYSDGYNASITGLREGNAVLSLTLYLNDKVVVLLSKNIEIKENIEAILSLDTNSIDFGGIGDYKKITYKLETSMAENYYTIEWHSENPNIASIDQSGNVIAVGAGETQIYCTYKSPTYEVTAYCDINVNNNIRVTDFNLSDENLSFSFITSWDGDQSKTISITNITPSNANVDFSSLIINVTNNNNGFINYVNNGNGSFILNCKNPGNGLFNLKNYEINLSISLSNGVFGEYVTKEYTIHVRG